MVTTTSAVAAARGGDVDVREELRALNEKIDRLTDQIGFLHERTRVVNEFTTELMPIAKDAMAAVTDELVKHEQEFNTEELLHLVRRLLQSTPRFVWMIDQMESMAGLIEEGTPILKELMNTGIERLDEAERKGYFRLARGAAAMADQIGEHFDQKDIDALAGSFALMMDTVKKLTQPSMLAIAGAAAGALEGLDKRAPEPLSAWGMFKAMGDPDVQQGMGIMIDLLRKVARQATSPALPPPAKTNGAAKQLSAK